MTESKAKKVARVWRLAHENLKEARDAYFEEFGITVDDASINETVRRAFGYSRPFTEAVTSLPQDIVLALLLRSGGGARRYAGNPGKSPGALQAKAEMFALVEGRPAGQTRLAAAIAALELHGIAAGMIIKHNAGPPEYERAARTLLDQMKPSKRDGALRGRTTGR